jgi:hypothetical protein
MSDTPPILAPPNPKGSSPALALCLGFLPAVVALLSIGPRVGAGFLVFMTVASVICCLVSSFLLFKRGTIVGIIGGLLLLLLNGFVALCCGCAALMA